MLFIRWDSNADLNLAETNRILATVCAGGDRAAVVGCPLPFGEELAITGAALGVIISFKTKASFSDDNGIKDPMVRLYLPVRSTFPGPITVWDVEIVGGTQ